MKKFITIFRLILIGLCLTLFSCQEEDTIPKPVIDKGDSNYSIYSDETVEIKPEVTVEIETSYQWLENNKELSTKPTLVYGSKTIGIHKISFTAVNKGGVASSEYSVDVKAIPLAEITFSIDKEGITLKNGEEKTITAEVTSIRDCTFQWVENDKIIGTTKEYKYSSSTTGLHKLIFRAINAGGIATETLKINVSAIPLPTISFSQESYSTSLGKSIIITPTIESQKDVTYSWLEGEKEISTEKVLNYIFSKKGEHAISLKATNEAGTSTKEIKVNITPSFAYGAFVLNEGNMGNETGIISFIGRDGVKTDSVYQKANNGEKLGNVTQDMWIAKDKVYFIAQNGPEQIIVADRFTLKKESSITKDESGLDWPTHILVVSNSKAYVRDNAGLHTVDLNTMKVTGNVQDAGRANKQKMEFINGKAIVAAGDELLIIDPNDDSISKKIKFNSSISSGAIEGKDQCIWISTNNNTLHKIETNTFSIIKDYTIPSQFSLKGGFIPSCGLCASFKKDVVYWRDGGWNSAKLLKFDAETETASILINFAKDYTDANIAYGDVAVDPITDEVYMGVIKGFGMSYLINGLYVINGDTGNLTHPIYKNCVRFPTCTYFTENYNK